MMRSARPHGCSHAAALDPVRTDHRPAHEHQIAEQIRAKVIGDDLKQRDVRVVRVHPDNRSSSMDMASARSRALPPRTASNNDSNSPSEGLRAAASGTLG